MIEAKTLEAIREISSYLSQARSLIENLEEKERGEWKPGYGSRPMRSKKLRVMISDLHNMVDDMNKLWS